MEEGGKKLVRLSVCDFRRTFVLPLIYFFLVEIFVKRCTVCNFRRTWSFCLKFLANMNLLLKFLVSRSLFLVALLSISSSKLFHNFLSTASHTLYSSHILYFFNVVHLVNVPWAHTTIKLLRVNKSEHLIIEASWFFSRQQHRTHCISSTFYVKKG